LKGIKREKKRELERLKLEVHEKTLKLRLHSNDNSDCALHSQEIVSQRRLNLLDSKWRRYDEEFQGPVRSTLNSIVQTEKEPAIIA
jgi:hypothetical protein